MEWSAQVEWIAPKPYTPEDLDELVKVLGEYHISITQVKVPQDFPDTWEALLTVEARSLRRGAARAVAVVEAATGQAATSINIMLHEIRRWRAMQ